MCNINGILSYFVQAQNYFYNKVSEAFEPRLAHRAGAYPGFRSMTERLGVFLLPLE